MEVTIEAKERESEVNGIEIETEGSDMSIICLRRYMESFRKPRILSEIRDEG